MERQIDKTIQHFGNIHIARHNYWPFNSFSFVFLNLSQQCVKHVHLNACDKMLKLPLARCSETCDALKYHIAMQCVCHLLSSCNWATYNLPVLPAKIIPTAVLIFMCISMHYYIDQFMNHASLRFRIWASFLTIKYIHFHWNNEIVIIPLPLMWPILPRALLFIPAKWALANVCNTIGLMVKCIGFTCIIM